MGNAPLHGCCIPASPGALVVEAVVDAFPSSANVDEASGLILQAFTAVPEECASLGSSKPVAPRGAHDASAQSKGDDEWSSPRSIASTAIPGGEAVPTKSWSKRSIGRDDPGSASFMSTISSSRCTSTASWASCTRTCSTVLACPSGRPLHACSAEDLLQDVRTHLEVTHDIFAAESLVAELSRRLSPQEWHDLVDSELLLRFRERLEAFFTAGALCCLETDDWLTVFQDAAGTRVECFFDPSDGRVLHMRARVPLSARIAAAVAVANEHDLLPSWHPFMRRAPESIGHPTACLQLVGYQAALPGGFFKVDVLSEVQRFIDPEEGFMVEVASPVLPGHPEHREALRGYRRMEANMKKVWVAMGPNACLLVEAGTMRLPAALNKTLATTLVGRLAGWVVRGLQNAVLAAGQPDSPWEPLMRKDGQGLYEALHRCATSAGSVGRAAKLGRVGESDVAAQWAGLPDLFGRRGLLRLRPLTTTGLTPGTKRGRSVRIGPGRSVRRVPSRQEQKEMYSFLAEQHNRLKRAVEAYQRSDGDDNVQGTPDSRLAKSRVDPEAHT